MEIRGRHLRKVAIRLGFSVKEGGKHILVLGKSGLITTIPKGKIKYGTLKGILNKLGITEEELSNLL
jgi:hypothetical protein